ncbi:MAG: helix-turn-helix domain-containing protein [Promethearchaeota archaeon]|jgi:excisionase family DNA binding protein
MNNKEFLTVSELAHILGVSRISIYNKIKYGQIEALKFGKSYMIPKKYLDEIIGKALSDKCKKMIEKAVKKTFKEYGDVIKRLGKE